MRLSKKSRRNIAQFNQIKYSPNRAKYSVSPKTKTDSLVRIYEEIKNNDTPISETGPMARP